MQNIKNFFSKNKKKLLIAAIFVSLLSIIWIISKTKRQDQPSPTSSPIPLKFELLRANPSYGVGAQIIDTNAVDFKFSKPIDISTLVINIEPKINYSFETDGDKRILYISPNSNWETGQLYNISIDVSSEEGEKLPKKIDYQLQIKEITEGIPAEIFFSPEPENSTY